MKSFIATALAGALALAGAAQAQVYGFDISNWQPSVNFAAAYSSGARFVIIKVCLSLSLPSLLSHLHT